MCRDFGLLCPTVGNLFTQLSPSATKQHTLNSEVQWQLKNIHTSIHPIYNIHSFRFRWDSYLRLLSDSGFSQSKLVCTALWVPLLSKIKITTSISHAVALCDMILHTRPHSHTRSSSSFTINHYSKHKLVYTAASPLGHMQKTNSLYIMYMWPIKYLLLLSLQRVAPSK